MLLYIIRHGEPDYETDTLTPRGRKQAMAVAPRLKEAGVSRVFSSPMGRAKETACPTCRLPGLPMTVENRTHEIEPDMKRTPFPDGGKRYKLRLPDPPGNLFILTLTEKMVQ